MALVRGLYLGELAKHVIADLDRMVKACEFLAREREDWDIALCTRERVQLCLFLYFILVVVVALFLCVCGVGRGLHVVVGSV